MAVKLRNFPWLSLCGHALLFATATIETKRFQLSIKCRAADTQPARHLRHLAAVVGNSIPDKVGLDLFERAYVAGGIEQGESVDLIRYAVTHYRGQMSEVARRLRIGRSTLYRKLEALGLNSSSSEAEACPPHPIEIN